MIPKTYDVQRAAAADLSNVYFIDLTDRLCDVQTCPTVRDGHLVYRDDHHLTARRLPSPSRTSSKAPCSPTSLRSDRRAENNRGPCRIEVAGILENGSREHASATPLR